MIKRIFTAFILVAIYLPVFSQETEGAQNVTPINNDDVQLLYRNEQVFGVLAHSNGWGFNYRRGKHLTGYKKLLYEVEFVTMRHPKQIKTQHPALESSKGYFYGKLNSLNILRLGVGFQNVIYSKQDRRGVEIRYIANAGASLGFAKPVYLEILYETPVRDKFNISTEKYDPKNPRHVPDWIYGRAPFLKGFDQTKIYPGGYAKFGLSFEYADADDDIKAIETGVSVDVYPAVIPIMANARNNQVFVSLYINLLYGRKWF